MIDTSTYATLGQTQALQVNDLQSLVSIEKAL